MLCTRLPHVLLMRRACSAVAGGTPGSGQAGPMSSGRELGLCGAHSRPTRLRIATSKASGALLDKPQLQESHAGKVAVLLYSPGTEKLDWGSQLSETAPG